MTSISHDFPSCGNDNLLKITTNNKKIEAKLIRPKATKKGEKSLIAKSIAKNELPHTAESRRSCKYSPNVG
jgi:hypothetical protein